MNFQQLRSASAAARSGFNLSEAAEHLQTSQSGISRQIRELEKEIGLQLFRRSGKRFTGLTDSGQRLLPIVARILEHEAHLRSVSRDALPVQAGCLRLAATPTLARYVLPKAVLAFKARYPRVEIQLHQGSPEQVLALLRDGVTDIALTTDTMAHRADLASTPCQAWHHVVIVPEGHPLTQEQPLSLAALARHPIVTHRFSQMGEAVMETLYAAAGGVQPLGCPQEMDAEVVKTYVRQGLGVGVVASVAWDAQRDTGLVALDARHLFAPQQAHLALRQGMGLHPFQRDFMEGLTHPAEPPAQPS